MCEIHKPHDHNRASCQNHMTTIVAHVQSQPIAINQWHAIASSCKILWVKWSHSVKNNKPMTNNYQSCESLPCLVTVCDILAEICDKQILLNINSSPHEDTESRDLVSHCPSLLLWSFSSLFLNCHSSFMTVLSFSFFVCKASILLFIYFI